VQRTLIGCWLIKRDGSAHVICDALVGRAGDPLGGLTRDRQSDYHSPIEAKARILQRWIESTAPSPSDT